MPIKNCPIFKLHDHDKYIKLPIRIINSKTNQFIYFYGIIDTGATGCAIPATIATRIGYNLTDDKKVTTLTGGGNTTAFRLYTTIEIYHPLKAPREVIYTINNKKIDFIPNLPLVLLGVDEFLSNFVLNIDYPGHKYSLTR